MRLWPFGTEQRDQSFTDTVIAEATRQVTNAPAKAGELAAVEAATGAVGRAFVSAVVSGPGATLMPSSVAEIAARAMMREGEACFVTIGTRLVPVATWTIDGGADPEGWRYEVTTGGPSGTDTRTVPASDVLHFRWRVDPKQPWRGRSALELAKLSAATATAHEKQAERNGLIPPLWMLPKRGTVSADQAKQLMAFIQQAVDNKRGPWLPWPDSAGSSPQPMNARTDPGTAQIWSGSARALVEAMGVPSGLFEASTEGTAQRESLRRFAHGTLLPMARIIEAEMALKALAVSFDFAPLHAADAQGRSRAVKALVDAGMSLADAIEAVGMD